MYVFAFFVSVRLKFFLYFFNGRYLFFFFHYNRLKDVRVTLRSIEICFEVYVY